MKFYKIYLIMLNNYKLMGFYKNKYEVNWKGAFSKKLLTKIKIMKKF